VVDPFLLDSMDLIVAAGETTGLIGHNGAGKAPSWRWRPGCCDPTAAL